MQVVLLDFLNIIFLFLLDKRAHSLVIVFTRIHSFRGNHLGVVFFTRLLVLRPFEECADLFFSEAVAHALFTDNVFESLAQVVVTLTRQIVLFLYQHLPIVEHFGVLSTLWLRQKLVL